ncbi:hypothetical protein IC007_1418 [Sulfuracidifex tepidarius]|uniref:Uncharacterized protein n=1 Tax=Sulfuracidifex tepidarius TaxID=1294262 RepID=A0A510E308_9CREN|nr:hypothetical protein IC007_1418 [Sulfuracidifex tepidarius]
MKVRKKSDLQFQVLLKEIEDTKRRIYFLIPRGGIKQNF